MFGSSFSGVCKDSEIFNWENFLLKMTQYACAVDHVVWQSVTKINMIKSHFNLLQ